MKSLKKCNMVMGLVSYYSSLEMEMEITELAQVYLLGRWRPEWYFCNALFCDVHNKTFSSLQYTVQFDIEQYCYPASDVTMLN